jgi:hypothetical protein
VTCTANRDGFGTSYLIAAAPPAKTPKGRTLRGCPALDVWWSRDSRAGPWPATSKATAEETLIIRQEYENRSTADVLELTLGQAYDLIDALNKAVEAA